MLGLQEEDKNYIMNKITKENRNNLQTALVVAIVTTSLTLILKYFSRYLKLESEWYLILILIVFGSLIIKIIMSILSSHSYK